MAFERIVGQEAAVALLRRSLASGRLPHALLFQGPECVGKATVARELAAVIQCESGEACGRCGACRRLASGAHPDYLVITRLPKKSGAGVPVQVAEREEDEEAEMGGGELRALIVVDQIRALTQHASFAPQEGSRRVFVIDPADRMNAEAQNALLKTLEEPPGGALMILVSAKPHLLRPTVRSRCLSVRFAPVPVARLRAELEARGVPAGEATARAALAEGCPGRALRLDLGARLARRDQILSAFESLAGRARGLAELPSSTALLGVKEQDALLEALDVCESLLRDAARAASGLDGRDLMHADLAPRLAALGHKLGGPRAAALVRAIEALRADLRFNVNRTLLAETLLAAVAGGPVPEG